MGGGGWQRCGVQQGFKAIMQAVKMKLCTYYTIFIFCAKPV